MTRLGAYRVVHALASGDSDADVEEHNPVPYLPEVNHYEVVSITSTV